MLGHLGRVKSLVYSPDGKWLASGGDHSPAQGSDGESIRIWDAQTGQQIGELKGLDHSGIETISLSPDGKLLASSSHDTFVRIWDLQTRSVLHKLAGHTLEVDVCAFLPDGETLVSGCKDTTIKFWDVKTGQLLKTLTGHTGRVESLCVSPSGKTLVTGGGGGETAIRIWDISKIR
jgi:WD40 repeat protein